MASEREIIHVLTDVFGTNHSLRGVQIGIGDDAAVVDPFPEADPTRDPSADQRSVASTSFVATTDMAVEGTHFRRDWSSLHQVGAKIVAANLADLLAMGAAPRYLLVAVGVPPGLTLDDVRNLALGIQDEARSAGAVVIGGDTVLSPHLTIAITALGVTTCAKLRSSAQVGDRIFISALPGWSALGFEILNSHHRGELLHDAIAQRAVDSHLTPSVNYGLLPALCSSTVHALCDVSDALISDLRDFAEKSGTTLEIDEEGLRSSQDFHALKNLCDLLQVDCFDFIFGGGEDHIFLFTADSNYEARHDELEIGRVVAKASFGVINTNGEPLQYQPLYLHFSQQESM